MSEPAINAAVNEAVEWGDRKALLELWQTCGAKIPDQDWHDVIYPALVAVAQYGARKVAENLINQRDLA